jgi:hypothetical protein
VDQSYAIAHNLTRATSSTFVMRADSTKVIPNDKGVRGRDSIRIASKKRYGDSVLVLDLTHMPVGCGTWPAFWSVTADGKHPTL